MIGKSIALSGALIAANIAVWLWALWSFHAAPALLATAVLAYVLGLRHAVDADHIAAIDNVTRKLIGEGGRPLAVGCFFALGHSTVVIVVATVVAVSAAPLQQRFPGLATLGQTIGTVASATVLLVLAAANAAVLARLLSLLRGIRRGRPYRQETLDDFLASRGVVARALRRAFGVVSRGWHIYFIGLLFGLGFDTATEIGLLGIAATHAVDGLPIWSILVFPALFTAAMALVDTADGLLMFAAYGWATRDPVRKLYYNIAVTGLSVAVAAVIGGIEAGNLLGGRLGLSGGFWEIAAAVSDHLGVIGYCVIGVFVAGWAAAAAAYRLSGEQKQRA